MNRRHNCSARPCDKSPEMGLTNGVCCNVKKVGFASEVNEHVRGILDFLPFMYLRCNGMY